MLILAPEPAFIKPADVMDSVPPVVVLTKSDDWTMPDDLADALAEEASDFDHYMSGCYAF